ncbi:MAG: F0F1 ATP synthase subunit delta [Chromatiaceae bacterium]|nr:F0F1 ATP synthase subunit delta [Chromatiaceae bacterium]MCP5423211.1 F0F1 ATP synthase subunit delta [Chromatiaceae bacterium]
MGFDWSTFVLEIVNFLILVWILKRLLYVPVMAAIERRRQKVAAVLAEANAGRDEAERLRAEYESRREDWDRERTAARADLEQTLNAERERRIADIDAEIARRREQAAIVDRRERDEAQRHTEQQALALAAGFGARLLGRIADPALERQLVDLFVADLGGLPDGERRTFAANMGKGGEVRITSAWSLDPVQRAAVEDALADAADGPLTFSYAEDPELIAGLRVDAGALVMRANLRDELQFFAAAGR